MSNDLFERVLIQLQPELAQEFGYAILEDIKKLKALNEILALHDKWLGNEMSDFEFFTLLIEVRDKYFLKEVRL